MLITSNLLIYGAGKLCALQDDQNDDTYTHKTQKIFWITTANFNKIFIADYVIAYKIIVEN